MQSEKPAEKVLNNTPDVKPRRTGTEDIGERSQGSHNYIEEDVEQFFVLEKSFKPIYLKMWKIFAVQYNAYFMQHGKQHRSADELTGKFDKFGNTRKQTGERYCPTPIKKPKRITRDILSSVQAVSIALCSMGGDEMVNRKATVDTSDELLKFVDVAVVGEKATKKAAC